MHCHCAEYTVIKAPDFQRLSDVWGQGNQQRYGTEHCPKAYRIFLRQAGWAPETVGQRQINHSMARTRLTENMKAKLVWRSPMTIA
ncbi:hypothetical protein CLF_102674 [Clonorchis sinensis]|uniref:Uncharacterized protein n=1 Tax=Clonorchis sinensis TaxID=79923 RepID=G7Y8C2_CLOSI|nr:hypothetical protein CLF_102674 [Clonorchis sinensis]